MAKVQGFFCLPPLLLMQCFCVSFSWGFRPESSSCLLCHNRNQRGRCQGHGQCNFVCLPSQSPWKPRITDSVWKKPGGWGCLGATWTVMFVGKVSLYKGKGESKSIAKATCVGAGSSTAHCWCRVLLPQTCTLTTTDSYQSPEPVVYIFDLIFT